MIENYVEVKLNPCRKDLTGMKFGKLTVIKPVKTKNSKYTQWLCRCDCGNEAVAYSYKLLAGRVKSCGCLMTNIHPYKALKQENAELKAKNETLKSQLDLEVQKKEVLEIKNERLKLQTKELENRMRTLDEEDITVEITEDEFEKYKQLKSCLQEIKAIAENCYAPADKENDGFYTILQLITEAEEE